MKKAAAIFSILMVVLIGFVVWKLFAFHQKETKFEAQALGVTVSAFEEVWGKPDNTSDNGSVLFYSTENGLGHRYVFRFDKNNRLEGKYYDD